MRKAFSGRSDGKVINAVGFRPRLGPYSSPPHMAPFRLLWTTLPSQNGGEGRGGLRERDQTSLGKTTRRDEPSNTKLFRIAYGVLAK